MDTFNVVVTVPDKYCRSTYDDTPNCSFLIMGREQYECVLFNAGLTEKDHKVQRAVACVLAGGE